MSIKIYDPLSQTGENACSINRGNCSHLCLPVSATNRVCRCATGYYTHTTDPTRCVGECLYQMKFQTNETKINLFFHFKNLKFLAKIIITLKFCQYHFESSNLKIVLFKSKRFNEFVTVFKQVNQVKLLLCQYSSCGFNNFLFLDYKGICIISRVLPLACLTFFIFFCFYLFHNQV